MSIFRLLTRKRYLEAKCGSHFGRSELFKHGVDLCCSSLSIVKLASRSHVVLLCCLLDLGQKDRNVLYPDLDDVLVTFQTLLFTNFFTDEARQERLSRNARRYVFRITLALQMARMTLAR